MTAREIFDEIIYGTFTLTLAAVTLGFFLYIMIYA